MARPTPTVLEQFTVTATRDLAIRIIDTFHPGEAHEQMEAKRAFVSMVTEMFSQGVQSVDQCKVLLNAIRDGLEFGAWPTRETVGQTAHAVGEKAHKTGVV
jgi:hypothetical protein